MKKFLVSIMDLLGISLFFIAFVPVFHSPYFIPKVILLFLGVLFFCFTFLTADKVTFPKWSVVGWFLIGLFLMGLSLFSSSNDYDSLFYIAQFVGIFVMYIGFLNVDTSQFLDKQFKSIPFLLFLMGVFQSLIVVGQAIAGLEPVGLMGNSEFLATLLGVSFFMGLSLSPLNDLTDGDMLISAFFTRKSSLAHQKINWVAIRIWLGIGTILAGLFITQNKGALLFVGTYIVFRYAFRQKWLHAALWAGFILLGVFIGWSDFVVSLQSRLFLWIVGGWMMIHQPLLGVGIGQFGHLYTDMIFDLFQRFPFLSLVFGTYSSAVGHAHQLFLQYGSELGIFGVFWILSFVIYSLKRLFDTNIYFAAALLFLLFKSMYTVVFASISGAILWILILSEIEKPKLDHKVQFTGYGKLLITLPIVLLSVYAFSICLSDFHYFKGRQALIETRLETAEASFEQTLRYHPGHSESFLSMAYLSYLKQDFRQMDSYLQEAHFLYHDLNTIKLEADMRFYLGQLERARPLYHYLYVVFPDHLDPRIKLALIEFQLGDTSRGKAYAQEALDYSPRISNPVHDTYRSIARELLLK